jgi:flagellar basal body P-ring formation protein FlgA
MGTERGGSLFSQVSNEGWNWVKTEKKIVYFILLLCLHLLPAVETGLGTSSDCFALEAIHRLQVQHEVWVGSNRVTLLDLFQTDGMPEDWKTMLAGIDLGEAPSAGNNKFIASDPLRGYLEQLFAAKGINPTTVNIELPPGQVTIKRQTNHVTQEEIERIYKEHILSNAPWKPEDMEIHNITYSGMTDLPSGEVSHWVESNPKERYIGNVILTIDLMVDGKKKRSIKAAGKVQLTPEVVVATRPLKKHETIGDGDVGLQRFNVGEKLDRYAMSIEQVLGKRLLRDVGLYQAVCPGDLDTPHILKKGATVTILYELPGLKVSAKGLAREDGKAGSTVRIVNTQTNRTVLCEIVDGSTVRALP